MRILKAIYFINSANIPYTEIRLDGNVHIAGVNGVGKSTILRAILFFYNADTKKLGIEPEQRPFSEFYLRYPNSYIVYEIVKENDAYLVLVFRYQNRAGFRFVKTPFAKELFIDEHNRAKFPREVVQTLNAQKLFYSPIIERHKEFREIIYGIPSKVKTRPFSLFESKSYANIPRTISNIFLNYKLESEFIKKSIIYSLVEPDDKRYQINLSAIREPLEKIDGYLRDIDLYTNNEQTAKDIARQYERILTIEADKHNMAIQLGGSVKFAAVEKKDAEEKIEFLNAEIGKLQDMLNDLDRKFTNTRDTLIGQISILKDKLKEAKKKQAHYQSIHIDNILEKVTQKAFHEKSLEAFQQQKVLLLKKAQHIENAFNSQIAQLEQDQRELVFNIDQEKLQAEKTVEQEKRAIEQQYQRKIREKERFYQQKLSSLENHLEQV